MKKYLKTCTFARLEKEKTGLVWSPVFANMWAGL